MEPSKPAKVTMRRGEPCVTPEGPAVVGIHMGDRVRCDFPGGRRKTFNACDVVPAQIERPAATVVSLADTRRTKVVRPVTYKPIPGGGNSA